ncbi:Chloroperoxidase [Flammula alnicola]|nr:Chloroperoxidase [Flammula alnicola]
MSPPTQPSHRAKNHEYRRNPPAGGRSPCPALNTLANHGYISRGGSNLTFFEVFWATVFVYNLSYPLAFLLTLGGFIASGTVSFHKISSNCLTCLIPSFTLDLASLSTRGSGKIAHDASFVHPNGAPSTSPDPALLKNLLQYASKTRDLHGHPKGGLGLVDIAQFHSERVKSSPSPLDNIHNQIALGECALTWEVLRGHKCSYGRGCQLEDCKTCSGINHLEGVVPVARLEQWFGDERLPHGWWDAAGGRPAKSVGLLRTRRMANLIGQLATKGPSKEKRIRE